MQIILDNLAGAFELIKAIWWIILPPAALFFALENWRYYIEAREMKGVKWVLLEIKIPREILKTPEAMERVFTGLHGPYDPPTNFKEWYLKPNLRLWYNFEIVGQGGDIRFFAYVPRDWRSVVEAQMYAQYPDVSIAEAEDYAKDIPDQIPAGDYDLWGCEFSFGKPDAYPIVTYKDFTALSDPKVELEALKVDPLSAFAETLAKLKPGENIWFQILARPCGSPGKGPKDNWQAEGQAIVDKLAGRPEKLKAAPWYAIPLELIKIVFEEAGIIFRGVVTQAPQESEQGIARVPTLGLPAKTDEKKDPSKMQHATPGERDVIYAVEKKIAKLGFECIVRMIYVARRDVMDKAKIGALFGIIKQFNTQHLNAFKPTGATLTKKLDYFWGFIQSARYEVKIKRGLIYSYKKRSIFWDVAEPLPLPHGILSNANGILGRAFYRLFPNAAEFMRSKPIVLNTEELATLFHFPGGTVSSPLMSRMQAKQMSPPSNLPIG